MAKYKLKVDNDKLNTYGMKELLLLICGKLKLEFDEAELKESVKKHFEVIN